MKKATTLTVKIIFASILFAFKMQAQCSGPELVTNGNFDAGNTSFSTDYNYSPKADFNANPGNITISNTDWVWGSGATDHANGTGNFMLVDGALNTQRLWYNTYAVVPDSNYTFSIWAIDVGPKVANTVLSLSVNGTTISALTTVADNWTHITGTWNSGYSAYAEIEVIAYGNAGYGHDFAIDDISFRISCDSITNSGGNTGNCQALFNGIDNGAGVVDFFDASTSSGNNVMYTWDYGDGDTNSYSAYSYQTQHTYLQNGTYTVCLTISDTSIGCSNKYCKNISVWSISGTTSNCDASFASYDNTGGEYDFDAINYSSSSVFSWNFGDGATSSDYGNTSHQYLQNGMYNVCLTITDSAANCTATYCDYVMIFDIINSDSCDASFYGNDNGYGEADFFGITANSPTADYSWDFGDGSTGTNVGSESHIYAQNGTYTVCLTINNVASNCSNTYCEDITIYSAGLNSGCSVTADFTVVHDTVNKYNYTIYSAATNGVIYLWSFGDGTYSTDQFPIHTYPGTGPYELCLAVIDSSINGVCYNYHCDSILDAGRSVATLQVVNAALGVKENKNTIETLANYPNPFNTLTTITYAINKNAFVELSIVDLLGNTVSVIEKGNKSSGKHSIDWTDENVASGIYLLKLKVDGQVTTKKLLINK